MISAKNLDKSFGGIRAVDHVSLSVDKGEVLGFLGPNGAGKTTTMRLLTGYLEPDAGEIRIGGADMIEHPMLAKAKIGYLPENAPVYRDMNVKSFLHFVAGVRGLGGKKAGEAIDRAVSVCHLEKVFYQSIDTLSKGYVRRTSFAQSILHDPPVLVLDEPTDGLDPNQKFDVREMIKEMGRDKAIIISTHILEEVDACCTRVLIISEGRIVANGTPSELRSRSAGANSLVVSVGKAASQDFRTSIEAFEVVAKVAEMRSPIPDAASFRIFPSKGQSPARLCTEVASFAKNKNLELLEIRTDDGRLEDVFRQITSNKEAGR